MATLTTTASSSNKTRYTASTLNATAVNIKGSAGTIHGIACDNSANGTTTYLKIWNLSSPTVGTDVPLMVIPVAGGDVFHMDISLGGIAGVFTSAISVAAVTGEGVTSTTSPSSAFNVDLLVS